MKVIACSSVDLTLGDHPESWTLCSTFKYAFLDLDDWLVELPPMITLISPSGGRDDFSIFPFNFSSKEISQFSLSYEIFNLLL